MKRKKISNELNEVNYEMRKNKKGFTLAELLIVVAIIAVLVAVAIPIFTYRLEKAREAVDLENIRSAYSIMQYSKMFEQGPNGETLSKDNTYYFYLQPDGHFEEYIYREHQSSMDTAYTLKSHHPEISEWVTIYDDSDLKGTRIALWIQQGEYLLYCY